MGLFFHSRSQDLPGSCRKVAMLRYLLIIYLVFFLVYFLVPASYVMANEPADRFSEMKNAIFNGQKQKFKNLLDEVVNINAADPEGELLETAVFFSRNWAVKELIRANCALDKTNGLGVTPLMMAVRKRGNLPLVKILFEAGANIHYINQTMGGDILSEAIKSGDSKIIDYIITKMAGNLPERCIVSGVALGVAVGRDNLAVIKRLLKDSNQAIEYLDHFHQTPLMQAVKRGNWQTYSFLLSKNPDLTTVDNHENSLLHAAIQSPLRNKKIIADLLKRSADPKSKNKFGQTPLDLAVQADDPAIIKMLIDAGADPNQISGSGEVRSRLLARAFLAGKFKAAHELMKYVSEEALNDGLKGAILSQLPQKKFLSYLNQLPPNPVRDGKLLALGGQRGEITILEKLLARGAELNALEGDRSAVMHATAHGKLEALKWLDQKGADLNLINAKKSTALHLAAGGMQAETLQYLLDRNVIFDRRDDQGETALFAAARSNFVPGIEKLLSKGANAGILNNHHYNPLMVAVENRAIEVTRALASQSPLSAADTFGRSALHIAIYWDRPDLVQILINECAPTNQKDRHGQTPYDYLFYAQKKNKIRDVLDSRAQIEKCRSIN